MNKDELIAELATKYHKVDEVGIHENPTFEDRTNAIVSEDAQGVFTIEVLCGV